MESGKRVVIIGSGIGGLVCGAILSREGYQVTILERNKQIGGNLQTFARDKRIFDSGVHYVGGLEPGQNTYKIFKYLGIMDKLKLQKLDEHGFDRIYFGTDDKEYCYAQGYDNFIETLAKDFPDERPAIQEYCDKIKDVCDGFPLYNLKMGDSVAKAPFLEIDTKAFIASLTNNVRLQNVLAGSNCLYAGVADKTPFYVHALVINSYIESSYRFIDGGSQITRLLTKVITENGGILKNRSDVKKINVENGAVKSVTTAGGISYEADIVISNAHPAQTLRMTETDVIRTAYRNRIASMENSASAFILNISIKPESMKYEKTNYYASLVEDVWDTINHTEDNWPLGYAMFYSASSKSEEWAEGVTLMAYMHFNEVDYWKDTFNTTIDPNDRHETYQEFKKRKAEKLLEVAYKKFPQLKDAMLNYYAATPLTFRDYMDTDDGHIYGISKNYRDPLKTFILPRTKVKNLLLTGQNINLHGVLGVAVSSLVTCSELIGMEHIIESINNAQTE